MGPYFPPTDPAKFPEITREPDIKPLRYEESWRDLTSFKGKVSSAWALAKANFSRMRTHTIKLTLTCHNNSKSTISLHQMDFTFSSVLWPFFGFRGVPPAWCNLRIDLSRRSLCLWLIENLSSSALRGSSVLSPLKATSSPNELWTSLAPSLLLDSPLTTLVKYPVLGRGGAISLAFLQSVQWSNVYCDHDHVSSVHTPFVPWAPHGPGFVRNLSTLLQLIFKWWTFKLKAYASNWMQQQVHLQRNYFWLQYSG